MVGKKGPFGGFCNYGIFGIWGKDPGTGKKKYKKVDAGFRSGSSREGGQPLAAWIRRVLR